MYVRRCDYFSPSLFCSKDSFLLSFLRLLDGMGAVYEGGTVGRKGGSYAGQQREGGRKKEIGGFIYPILLVGDSFQKHTRAVFECSEMLDIT